MEVTPEGFTKEVVKLEDGDLNQWPQLSVRIENLLTALEKDGVVHVAVVYDATCVRLPRLSPQGRSQRSLTQPTGCWVQRWLRLSLGCVGRIPI